MNLWDFFLMFGTVNQTAPENVMIHNFQGVYLSPQQAKALLNVLKQNISQYEATFGEIKLEPHPGQASAPVSLTRWRPSSGLRSAYLLTAAFALVCSHAHCLFRAALFLG